MRIWALLAAVFVLLTATTAHAQPAPRVRIALAPETAAVVPGGTVHVALKQTIEPGWHTYWRNPGDSGEPTTIAWALPAGWRAGEIVWPTPKRKAEAGDILTYAYDGEVLLPVPIAVPADARVGETVTLRADARWLVCKDICIPEEGRAEVTLPVVAGAPEPHPAFGRAVAAALAAAPKPAGLTAALARDGAALKLAAVGPELAGADLAGAYLFPFDGTALTHNAPQTVERGPEGLTLTLQPGLAFQSPEPPTALAGVLALASGEAFEINAVNAPLPAGSAGLGAPVMRADGGGGGGGGLTLPVALVFALLGGLILNLMPCVFPVLSMKAASLAGHAHDRRAARVQGLAFAAGVVATFLALAGTLIVLKAAGQAVGWGFQLQSPAVVAGLALLMLLIALNLSGVFEVGGSVQNLGADAASRGGAAGAFGTGALAVVVAAPCTAPFMAGAMGYALTQSAGVSLLVFAALAVGFTLPFTALSFSPALLKRLPRPGPWMDTFRKVLAFPMYGAALWLAWVFAQQTGTLMLGWLFVAGLVVAFAAWLSGRPSASPLNRRAAALGGAAAVAAVAVVAFRIAPEPTSPASGVVAQQSVASIATEPFSPERLATLRAEGRPVFVNFTADWCVTCKVNERAALASGRVADAFRETGVVYLKGDWTRRDDVIARTLAEHGRSGVPLYLLYSPGRDAPQKLLPQLLTEGAVVQALKQAAAAPPAAQKET